MEIAVRAVCLLAVVHSVLSSHDLSSTYPFNAKLHENYTLYWSFDDDAQNIRFAVRVRTTGWVGLGLSPNGQMPQSDVVIGWVDGAGNTFFDDRFASGRSLPAVDSHQDWFLVSGEEEGGYTTLEFTRNYTSCDTKDRNIRHETARVIWSWRNEDPDNNVPAIHQFMGVTSLNLLGGLVDRPADPPDARTLSITVNNITLPNVTTTYWCAAFRSPPEFETQTFYITKFSAVIQPGNEPYVHHFLVFICNGLDDVELGDGGPCGSVDRRIQQCLSGALLGGWAVGGEEFVFPSNVAYPLGGEGASRYIVIEIHYDNPGSGRRDNSGMIFTYTSRRRQHDAGILSMGHLVTQGQIIPPNADSYTTYGVCPSGCTQNIPSAGIKIFGTFLHTHLVGSGVELSMLRRRNDCNTSRYEQVEIVDRNLNYDFNYQQFVHLPREVTVMPGDTFLTRCIYRTANIRTGVTLGGLSTHNEMCLASVLYYPRIPMEACISSPVFSDYANFVRQNVPANLQSSFLGVIGVSITPGRLSEILNQIQWTQQQIQAFENSIYRDGLQVSLCNFDGRTFNRTTTYTPQVCCPYEEPDTCTSNEQTTPSCCSRQCAAIREVSTTTESGATSTMLAYTFIPICLFVIVQLVVVL